MIFKHFFKQFLLLPFIFLVLAIPYQSCRYDVQEEIDERITLIRYSFPETQTEQEFIDGMAWLFSYLGAELPKEKFSSALTVRGNKIFVKLELLGFEESALTTLRTISSKLKNTEEYTLKEGIDAGRFFAICFNSSYNYYKITGAEKSFIGFLSKYSAFNRKQFACDSSSISKQARLIEYGINENILTSYFISYEGKGFFSSSNFIKANSTEVFDFMKNGQPRFMIYDEQGNLKTSSNPFFSNAGKPAKCMWCHESGIQPLFRETPDIAGYLTKTEFLNDRNLASEKLEKFHAASNSYINYSDKKIHTQAEYIYLSYYEPNANRLAMEWNVSESKVLELLSGISTHTNPEFPFLKNVYHRREVENFSPIKSLPAASDARESSVFEPEY
ncbi:MAG: hypothetical protein ACK48W_05970 [Bacteroidota bacterium]